MSTTPAPFELIPASLDDVTRLTTLINRSETFDGIPRILDTDELHEELSADHIDLERDSRLALVDGELVGWVLVDHRPVGEVQERAFINGTVDPAHRGRGIGRALIGWGVDVATGRLGAIDNPLPKYIRVYAYEQIADLRPLLARFGFTDVRWFEELMMSLDVRPEPITPDGVSIQPWPIERFEELRLVKNAAFADHWGSTPSDTADWNERVNGFGLRLDTSRAAVDTVTGELVGLCLTSHYPADEVLTGRRDGWIDTLATLGSWRGRGLASALIAHSLEAFAGVDFTHAMIAVDSASPTGASRLYRALGFELQHRQVVAELQIG